MLVHNCKMLFTAISLRLVFHYLKLYVLVCLCPCVCTCKHEAAKFNDNKFPCQCVMQESNLVMLPLLFSQLLLLLLQVLLISRYIQTLFRINKNSKLYCPKQKCNFRNSLLYLKLGRLGVRVCVWLLACACNCCHYSTYIHYKFILVTGTVSCIENHQLNFW